MTCVRNDSLWGQVVGNYSDETILPQNLWILPLTTVLSDIYIYVCVGVYLPMHSLVLLQVTKHVTCMSRDAEIIGVNGIETVDASIDDIARWR